MRVDADDLARPCGQSAYYTEVREVLIEENAIKMLGEEMSEGTLKEYISPLVLCDTEAYASTEEILEDIYDRGQVLVLDSEGLKPDEQAMLIVENNMDDDIDLVLSVGSGAIHEIGRRMAGKYKIPCISLIYAEDDHADD